MTVADQACTVLSYARTLTSAREFEAAGRLEEWVHAYLLSDGRNKPFSDGLKKCPRFYPGIYRLPAALFTRCCGPEYDMKFRVESQGFELHVKELMDAIVSGEDMPPLIANCTAGGFVLNDGNHRFEAYTRLGAKECDVIIWITDIEARDWFIERFGTAK